MSGRERRLPVQLVGFGLTVEQLTSAFRTVGEQARLFALTLRWWPRFWLALDEPTWEFPRRAARMDARVPGRARPVSDHEGSGVLVPMDWQRDRLLPNERTER